MQGKPPIYVPKKFSSASWFAGGLVFAALLGILAFRLSNGLALVFGILIGLTAGNPAPSTTKRLQGWILGGSVVLMGASLDFSHAVRLGMNGFGWTSGLLVLVLASAFLLSRILRLDRDTGILIAVGTAICGGSAIAAVAAVLKPKDASFGVSLAVVFVLNAIALWWMPLLGHQLDFSETSFGWWAALAIHDTSSVVGAAGEFGPVALNVGMTVKLARALWIVPVTAVLAAWHSKKYSVSGVPMWVRPKVPWFIPAFLIASAGFSLLPSIQGLRGLTSESARLGFGVALFLVGMGISRRQIAGISPRIGVYALCLWVVSILASALVALHLGGRAI